VTASYIDYKKYIYKICHFYFHSEVCKFSNFHWNRNWLGCKEHFCKGVSDMEWPTNRKDKITITEENWRNSEINLLHYHFESHEYHTRSIRTESKASPSEGKIWLFPLTINPYSWTWNIFLQTQRFSCKVVGKYNRLPNY
jgi:hypothetical protein